MRELHVSRMLSNSCFALCQGPSHSLGTTTAAALGLFNAEHRPVRAPRWDIRPHHFVRTFIEPSSERSASSPIPLSLMPRPDCPAENTAVVEETTFFSKDGINWTPHTIGWSIAGGCAILVCLFQADQSISPSSLFTQTLFISLVSVLKHCRSVVLVIPPVVRSALMNLKFRNYTNPTQQRQMYDHLFQVPSSPDRPPDPW